MDTVEQAYTLEIDRLEASIKAAQRQLEILKAAKERSKPEIPIPCPVCGRMPIVATTGKITNVHCHNDDCEWNLIAIAPNKHRAIKAWNKLSLAN